MLLAEIIVGGVEAAQIETPLYIVPVGGREVPVLTQAEKVEVALVAYLKVEGVFIAQKGEAAPVVCYAAARERRARKKLG